MNARHSMKNVKFHSEVKTGTSRKGFPLTV